MKSLIAICVGHSRKVNSKPEGGAVTHDGTMNEWRWNVALAELIAKNLHAARVKSVIVSEYEGAGYTASMRWLASHLKSLNATLAIELHFNSSDNPDANGHEWLFWIGSRQGQLLATSLSLEMSLAVPEIKWRGAKPISVKDRGAEFVRRTHCPAVVCEPFFGSSPMDWSTAQKKRAEIARAIANGILEYLD